MSTWTYRQTQERPGLAFTWYDGITGDPIDFSTGYTFTLTLVHSVTGATPLTKSAGIQGASTAPNVQVAWDTNELNIPVGDYKVRLRATTGGEDRDFRNGSEPYLKIIA